MIIERIKFYADTEFKKNVYHCYNGYGVFNFPSFFERFWLKGYIIRAAWIEVIDKESKKVLSSIKCNNLNHYEAEFFVSLNKGKTANYSEVSKSLR